MTPTQGLDDFNVYTQDPLLWVERKGKNGIGMEAVVAEKAEKTGQQQRHQHSEFPVGEAGARTAARNWEPSRSGSLLISLLHAKACFLKELNCPIQGETRAQLHPLDRSAGQESE